ncbi:O-antigen ligase family protein [bacterium]|jgi:putative inorganic carbon (HCO3(-)) transporter|nr:O-antigen ligase family protein [bacterium]
MEEKRIKLLSWMVRPARVLDLAIISAMSLVVFARPFFSGIVFPRSNYIFLVLWFLLLIMIYARNIIEKEAFVMDVIACLLLAFFLVSLLSSRLSSVPWRGRNLLVNQITWIVIYISVFNYFKKRESYNFIIYVMAASVILISLYGLYQYFYGLQETRDWVEKTGLAKHLSSSLLGRLSRNRVFSLFVYPNALAGFLVLTFPVVLSVFIKTIKERDYRKYGNIIIAASAGSLLLAMYVFRPMLFFPALIGIIFSPLTVILALYLTFSKGGLLSFFIMSVFYLLFAFFRSRSRMRSLALAMITVIVVILVSSALLFQKYKGDFFSSPRASAKVRFDYWKAGIEMVKEKPLLGVGSGAFGVFYPKYKLPEAQETQMAHNDYVQFLAETGITGFFFYISAIIIIIFNMAKNCMRMDLGKSDNYLMLGIFMGVAGLLIDSAWEFVLYIPGISSALFFLSAVFISRNNISRPALNLAKNRAVIALSLAVILAAFIFSYSYSKSIVDSADLLEQSSRAFQEKQEASALDFINRAIISDPENAQLREYRGSLYEYMGYYEKALADFRDASRLEPTTGYYHFKIATAVKDLYLSSGRKLPADEIELELRRAISCYPTKAFYYLQLGLFYDKIKNYGEAMANLEKAAALEPEMQGLDELIFQVQKKITLGR